MDMRDEMNDGWSERAEFLDIIERKDILICTCDDFGIESCPIHKGEDYTLEIIETTINKYDTIKNIKNRTPKGTKKTSKKTRKTNLDRV